MKKILILLVLVAAVTSSCENFLDTEPIDKIALEQYITSEEGLTQSLAGVYDQLGSDALYGNMLYYRLEACTDEGYYARSAQKTGPQVYDFNRTDVDVTNMWTALYSGIDRANVLIANINVPEMDETKRQVILGEALFLRGYYHFMLVTRFGDVPLKIKPTTSPNGASAPRTPTAEVYAQIIKDMTEAEAKVSTSAAIGYSSRVSETVVEGILARVCLQMAGYPLMDTSKYADALSWSKKAIDSGENGLKVTYNSDTKYNVFNPSATPVNTSNNAYRQIFIDESEDVYDVRENMWEIDFKGNRADGYLETGRLGVQIGITMTPSSASSPLLGSLGYCYGFIKGTGVLFKKYDATGLDLRRDWALTTYTFAVNNTTNIATKTNITKTMAYGRDCGKWRREYEALLPKNKNYSPTNFPILRYADVLLMYAEASNQVNGPTASAVEYVNQVRRRGYGFPINTPNVVSDMPATASTSKTNMQLFIEDERMRELCFEGLRKSDLIRWGKFYETMQMVSNDQRTQTTNAGQQYGALGGENVGNDATKTKYLLLPIPSLEILANKSIKDNNPGW